MPLKEQDVVGIDFETYGSVSLPDHGLDRYVSDKYFTPLMVSGIKRMGGLPMRRRYYMHNLNHTPHWFEMKDVLANFIEDRKIVAHNAGFEKRVCDWLELGYPASRFVDSAMVARAAGAASKLEASSRQLLGMAKLDMGEHLIKVFCVPGEYQKRSGSMAFDPAIILDKPDEWDDFGRYCDVDAELGVDLVLKWGKYVTDVEHQFNAITMDMNSYGWNVDTELVHRMQLRYQANQAIALADFRDRYDAKNLNLNSLKQLKEWTLARGVKANSFDEAHCKSLLRRIEKKLESTTTPPEKREGYEAVADLLRTKQVLGGSSLKKLQTIIDVVGEDGRLRDQYLHGGAGQTMRTSGRSVQMQNLKRFGGDAPAEIDDLVEADNTELGRNMRLCFTASHPDGRLIVGDFSSVESRGLAYLAGEVWKIQEYLAGKDLYKVLAAKMFHIDYEEVVKSQRQTGKVGELSCGYGAGGGAVQEFAKNMSVELSEVEASTLVRDWRAANPKIVEFWADLDEMLKDVIVKGKPLARRVLPFDALELLIGKADTPQSLLDINSRAQSIEVSMWQGKLMVMSRVFHGVYDKHGQLTYYKPSSNKGGPLWKDWYINPKTKQQQDYTIYGGKLAGIITQSFCRELFFRCLAELSDAIKRSMPNVKICGQFHDEIVLDWWPGAISLDMAEAALTRYMSHPGSFNNFPLAAEVHSDYRYTK